MREHLYNDIGKSNKSSELFSSISFVLSKVMHINDTKLQVLETGLTHPKLKLDFLRVFLSLAKAKLVGLERSEQINVAANCFKILRLLTDEPYVLERVFVDYPTLINEVRDKINNFSKNEIVFKEVRGLLYNWK